MNLYDKYKFHKGELNQDVAEYKGYRIEIFYTEKYGWEADAFDLIAQEYVFYPCTKIKKKNTTIEHVIEVVIARIDKKIELNDRTKDILIYE